LYTPEGNMEYEGGLSASDCRPQNVALPRVKTPCFETLNRRNPLYIV